MNHLEEQICLGINQASELPEAYRADVIGIYGRALAALERGIDYQEVANIITPIRGDVELAIGGRKTPELESFILHAIQRLDALLSVRSDQKDSKES